ncbi:rCG29080 [Rattus norvegicus]|uniref:RCG29080 n=1 Tax=Rattus norvegicus TaxID=10116 RepID=A6HWA2_RAT|nr:rCG29080 [Rattus norvegicus]
MSFFFFIFINSGISYLHFDCYSLSRFPSKHPPNPSPSPEGTGCAEFDPIFVSKWVSLTLLLTLSVVPIPGQRTKNKDIWFRKTRAN